MEGTNKGSEMKRRGREGRNLKKRIEDEKREEKSKRERDRHISR